MTAKIARRLPPRTVAMFARQLTGSDQAGKTPAMTPESRRRRLAHRRVDESDDGHHDSAVEHVAADYHCLRPPRRGTPMKKVNQLGGC
jgi:hypothetical protein